MKTDKERFLKCMTKLGISTEEDEYQEVAITTEEGAVVKFSFSCNDSSIQSFYVVTEEGN